LPSTSSVDCDCFEQTELSRLLNEIIEPFDQVERKHAATPLRPVATRAPRT